MFRVGVVMVVTSCCLLGSGVADAKKPHRSAHKSVKKSTHKAATTSATRTAGGDSVVGRGSLDLLEGLKATLTVDAHSTASGGSPSGNAEGESLLGGVPTSFGGRVTCLKVTGHTAVVKYAFDHAAPEALVGGGIEIFVKDAGTGLNDQMGFLPPQDAVTWQAAGPSRCDDLDLATFQTQTGDFTVTDG